MTFKEKVRAALKKSRERLDPQSPNFNGLILNDNLIFSEWILDGFDVISRYLIKPNIISNAISIEFFNNNWMLCFYNHEALKRLESGIEVSFGMREVKKNLNAKQSIQEIQTYVDELLVRADKLIKFS